MAFSWQPDPNGLSQIVQLLRESQNPDTATQRVVEQVGEKGRSAGKKEGRLVVYFAPSSFSQCAEVRGSKPVPRLQQLPHLRVHKDET